MNELEVDRSEDAPDGRPAGEADANEHRGWRVAYLLASLTLIVSYPVLSTTGRNVVFLLASLAAMPAVYVGLRRLGADHRRPWVLLLVALAIIDVANVIALWPGHRAAAVSGLVDALGNLVALAAAAALVTQQARGYVGRIIDTIIVAVALSAVLWDVVLRPNLLPDYRTGPTKLALCLVVFALSGVLGALAQLLIQRRVPALRQLMLALALALAANIALAVTTATTVATAANMAFMGAYTAVGLFGLDPSATRLATLPPARDEALSLARLLFLGVAVAVVPAVVGGRELAGGGPDGLVLIVYGVTIASLVMTRIGLLTAQRNRAAEALHHAATHDPLTGLANRSEFVSRLGDELTHTTTCAILFCDLDRFKEVNDRFGHAYGDQVLIEVARRLRACVRAGDVISRFGGDEFVVLLCNTTPEEASAVERRISRSIAYPVHVSGEPVSIGISTGTALTVDNIDPEDLITQADHAMYTAKSNMPHG